MDNIPTSGTPMMYAPSAVKTKLQRLSGDIGKMLTVSSELTSKLASHCAAYAFHGLTVFRTQSPVEPGFSVFMSPVSIQAKAERLRLEVAVDELERLALRAVAPRATAQSFPRSFRPLYAGGVLAARELPPPRLSAHSGRAPRRNSKLATRHLHRNNPAP